MNYSTENAESKAEIGAPKLLASVIVEGDAGLKASVYQMKTGGYFVHVEFTWGGHFYSPIFRDDHIASAEMARMAHNAAIIESAKAQALDSMRKDGLL